MKSKICTICKNDLPVSSYSLQATNGHPRAACKRCTADKAQEYRNLKKSGIYVKKSTKSEVITDPTQVYRICKDCNNEYQLTDFLKRKKGNLGACWSRSCRYCSATKQQSIRASGYRRPSQDTLAARLISIKHRTSKNKTITKKYGKSIKMLLSVGDVNKTIEEQTKDGTLYCAVTGTKLIDEAKHPLRPSIDRIESAGDYVSGNIRIVSLMYNLAKGKLTDNEFLSELKSSATRNICPNKLAIKLLSRKKRSNIRKKDITITVEDLASLIKSQTRQGIIYCAATGVPLVVSHRHSLHPSIDRINNSIGYTKNNIQIVAKAFNLGRNIADLHTAIESWHTMVGGLSSKMLLFEDEKINPIFEKINTNKIGKTNPKFKIRPKQCQIKLIDNKTINKLYIEHHYIGTCNSKFNVGIYYNKLIAGLSIRKPSRQNAGDWEISRMVRDSDYSVPGLWSYVMSWIIDSKLISGLLVTYSDDRLFTGDVYSKMGFTKSGKVKPDYYWVKDGVRYHKSGLRKTEEEKLTGKTERELREAQGYHKVWDLGKTKWVLTIDQPQSKNINET